MRAFFIYIFIYTCSRTKIKQQKIHFYSSQNTSCQEHIEIIILKAI